MLLLYCNFGLSSAMAAPDPAGPAGEVLSNWDGAGGQGEIFCSKCRRYGYRWYLYVYIYIMYVYVCICMYMYTRYLYYIYIFVLYIYLYYIYIFVLYIYTYLVGGLKHLDLFSIQLGRIIAIDELYIIFFRGRYTLLCT